MQNIVITKPTEKDLAGVSALAWPDIAVAKTRQLRLRHWFELGGIIIATDDHVVVGFSVTDRSFFDNGFIRNVIVAESHRRRGIGRRLVEVIMERSPTPKLFTATTQSNYPMRLLLDSLGWENVGNVRGVEDDAELFYRAPIAAERKGRVA